MEYQVYCPSYCYALVDMGHSMGLQGKDEERNSKPALWGEQTTSGNKGREGDSHVHCQGKGITRTARMTPPFQD